MRSPSSLVAQADGTGPSVLRTALSGDREMYHHRFMSALKARGRMPWLVCSPKAVLARPDLSNARKREILAFWMSDLHAVENSPALRQLPGGAIVRLDEIREALLALDGQSSRGRKETAAAVRRHFHARLGGTRHRFALYGPSGDGDDGPPKRPAGAARQAIYQMHAASGGGRGASA
jgi:hypothetical protein